MFGEEFLKQLAYFAAFALTIIAIAGIFLGCYFAYLYGNKNRRELEKRAGLFSAVEAHRHKEEEELDAMKKRRLELGRWE